MKRLSAKQHARLATQAATSLEACRAALEADGLIERAPHARREDWSAPIRELLAMAVARRTAHAAKAAEAWATCERLWWRLALSIQGAARRLAVRRSVRWTVLSVEDLTSHGLEGLYRAAQTWDPEEGSFQGYAHFWLVHHVNRALLLEGEEVAIPTNWNQRRQRLLDELDECERRGGGRDLKRAATAAGLEVEEAEAVLATFSHAERFDGPVHVEQGATDRATLLVETFPDDVETVEDALVRRDREQAIRAAGLALAALRDLPREHAAAALRQLLDAVATPGSGDRDALCPR